MARFLSRFRASEDGAGLVEYGLLLGLLAVGAAGMVTLYRTAVKDTFQRGSTGVERQASGGYGVVTVSAGGGGVAPAPDEEPEPGDSVAVEASGKETEVVVVP
jgi:Flp pilus assembly pilin Flp